jgi:hypothetical protein
MHLHCCHHGRPEQPRSGILFRCEEDLEEGSDLILNGYRKRSEDTNRGNQALACLKAFNLTLTPKQTASFNEMSKPVHNFPADFLGAAPSFCHAGATIDSIPSQLTPLIPEDDSACW